MLARRKYQADSVKDVNEVVIKDVILSTHLEHDMCGTRKINLRKRSVLRKNRMYRENSHFDFIEYVYLW